MGSLKYISGVRDRPTQGGGEVGKKEKIGIKGFTKGKKTKNPCISEQSSQF